MKRHLGVIRHHLTVIFGEVAVIRRSSGASLSWAWHRAGVFSYVRT